LGELRYGTPAEVIEIDDRILAHLKIVMLAKLRRREGFPFSFEYDATEGGGRTTVWIAAAVPLQFKFDGSRQPAINKVWLEALMMAANGVDGLRIIPEPSDGRTAEAGKS
jgi:hypothetical protein